MKPSPKPIVTIVKTGSTIPEIAARRGDFDAWIRTGMDWPLARTRVVRVDEGETLPAVAEAGAVVVTGSSAFVSEREAWSETAAGWLASLVEAGTPVLGICYGHQLLAHALRGEVGKNPRGRQIGTIALLADAQGDRLLGGLPVPAPLQATHVESVLRLPEGAQRLAETALDPNHAFRIGRNVWGVQFHPEFDADIMRGYLNGRRDVLLAERLDPDALLSRVEETPWGTAVLRAFAAIVEADLGT